MLKINKKIMTAVADILLVCLSYFLVMLIVSNEFMTMFLQIKTLYSVLLTSAFTVSAMYLINFYSYVWFYIGIKEYFKCIITEFIAILLSCVVGMAFKEYFLPIKFILVSGIFTAFLTVGLRIFIKYVFSVARTNYRKSSDESMEKMLIVGAGDAAGLVLQEIQKGILKYKIVGLVDDDNHKTGFMLYGYKVLGTTKSIVKICKEKKVDVILIAIPSLSSERRREIIDICNNTDCKIKIMPKSVIMLGKIDVGRELRNLQIEDLLERDVIKLDTDKISQYISGNKVLVTGGGGSIGSELCRQIASYNPRQLIIFDIYENNAYEIQLELKEKFKNLDLVVLIGSVRDEKRLEEMFCTYKPNIVFHAAAHKHVPLMEVSPGEAIKNNVCGTLNTCKCADKYGVEKFILISTDKAVNPTNIMGATKRICEMIVQSINTESKTEFAAVRFGNVLGSNGSVIPLFKKQIEKGGPLTVTHKEITRYFMTIPEASQLVLEAATFAKGGEIFVLDMGEPVKIYDLAKNIIKIAGFVPNKDIMIEEIGLRPGEKLYEELLMAEEGLKKTVNEKIFVAAPGSIDFDTLCKNIKELYQLACLEDEQKIRQKIIDMVPTFIKK